MGAPVFFVKKKDGSLHLVQDYHALNEITVKNTYPLLLISDILSLLSKAKRFLTLDLHWGFNNVCIKDGDEWKGASPPTVGFSSPLSCSSYYVIPPQLFKP